MQIITLDNVIFNNELHYENISDMRTYVDMKCNFCDQTKSEVFCKKCRIVIYCSHQCRVKDSKNHHDFCQYFQKAHIHRVDLVPGSINPRNDMIENHTKPLPLSHYKHGEFLVKLSHGQDHYGLTKSNNKVELGLSGETRSPYEVWVYDEFRNISGLAEHKQLTQLIRHLGRLASEKIYNKRVYLYARLISFTKDNLVIEVRSDLILHEQEW